MKHAYSWVWMISGVAPAILVILSDLGTPEEFKRPFATFAAVAGIVAVVATSAIITSVKRKGRRIDAVIAMALAVIGLTSLVSYWTILEQCAFTSPNRTAVFFPLWLSGTQKAQVNSAGGREAFYERYGAGAVESIVEHQSDELIWTKLLLAGLIVTASTSLPASIGVYLILVDRASGPGQAKVVPSGERRKKRSVSNS
jgi:hypothetical protein